ncbi:uncharacterized protein LOC139917000 [Centroberyx gerrardi]
MNRLLSLWLAGALLLRCCCENGGSYEEEEEEEEEYDEPTATPTPDYDYNFTYDYTFINESSPDYSQHVVLGDWNDPEPTDKASGIGRFAPLLLLELAVHQMWN